MTSIFDDFHWHDAEIRSIGIPRERPGHLDDVVLIVRPAGAGDVVVTFQRCVAAHLDLNFGVVAPETVRSASRVSDSEALREIRRKWGSCGVDLTELQTFELITNSTSSTIRVSALACTVEEVK